MHHRRCRPRRHWSDKRDEIGGQAAIPWFRGEGQGALKRSNFQRWGHSMKHQDANAIMLDAGPQGLRKAFDIAPSIPQFENKTVTEVDSRELYVDYERFEEIPTGYCSEVEPLNEVGRPKPKKRSGPDLVPFSAPELLF